ncbi:ApbE family lipoprotein [Novosphingobium nitrogenifigens DSM 19370]|uniref:FAD:protein FMN transferase n=1 Tax=Novosphingobium nitrogenifigens DSM 19370 TaxID=983920 RepID=F1Z983_9SPHN|nr:ApbE family lipoprotein [Novosphingobium nitrogenifigens DSM 19370]
MPDKVAPDAFGRCDPKLPVEMLAGQALGTFWQVRFVSRGKVGPDDVRTAIGRRLDAIVAEMSQWEPGSVLSRFNRMEAGEEIVLPTDFAKVIGTALDIAGRSEGAFDPTHGRAAALLGFGAEPARADLSPTDLKDAFDQAGWQRLAFDPQTRRLCQPGGLWLDFSGIAKGFAVDAVADLLGELGIEDALVEIGGELVARGLRPDAQPWWVDLESPPGAVLAPLRIGLHQASVATSGDYVRGLHTIDPSTGRPLPSRIASVSVLHDNAMLADAWATALTVLGPDRGLVLADRKGIAARFVERLPGQDPAFAETISAALARMIED